MENFTFFNPTQIEFGTGKEQLIGQHLAEHGISSVRALPRKASNGLNAAASSATPSSRKCARALLRRETIRSMPS